MLTSPGPYVTLMLTSPCGHALAGTIGLGTSFSLGCTMGTEAEMLPPTSRSTCCRA